MIFGLWSCISPPVEGLAGLLPLAGLFLAWPAAGDVVPAPLFVPPAETASTLEVLAVLLLVPATAGTEETLPDDVL